MSRDLYSINDSRGVHNGLKPFLDDIAVDDASLSDPSLAQGHTVAYDKEILIQICSEDNSQAPRAWQNVRLRLLALGADGDLVNFRAELDSEEDLFFHYTCSIDREEFEGYAQKQKLRVVYSDYPSVVVKMANDCQRDPNALLAVLIISSDGSSARLEFIQNFEYKLVELLSLPFKRTDAQRVRDTLTFRYRTMKAKTVAMAKRLDEIHGLVKIKSPSLLLKLSQKDDKTSQSVSAGNNSSVNVSKSNASPNRH